MLRIYTRTVQVQQDSTSTTGQYKYKTESLQNSLVMLTIKVDIFVIAAMHVVLSLELSSVNTK